MGKLKFKQILSNISYSQPDNQLYVSGSSDFAIIITGSLFVTSSATSSGSIAIAGIGTFGTEGSDFSLDLGENAF